ncbi:MAG: hypothetical protein A4E53_03701 [Pelotomaculum sp. PtaB.Bin104]|nr:MAG: hypothetical protein A4E53_03701 [Pelotomaculum sp. PtaB.Bin104]
MIYFLKAVSGFLLPPGIIIVILVIYSIWLYRREKFAARLLMLITIIFYLISTNFVGDMMIRSLESRYNPPQSIEGDVIVILGGGATLDTPDIDGLGHPTGATANRLITGARLYHALGVPIIVAGGQVFEDTGNEANIAKRILLGLGLPENKIIIEDTSLNTRENVQNVKGILEENLFQKPVLVTSAFHMERSLRNFSKLNINVQPFPTDYRSNINMNMSVNKFIPSYGALYNFSIGMREYLGIIALRVG